MLHFGLIIEMTKQGLLPRIISGSSGGSIVAGFLACNTDKEMAVLMKEGALERIQNRLQDHHGQA